MAGFSITSAKGRDSFQGMTRVEMYEVAVKPEVPNSLCVPACTMGVAGESQVPKWKKTALLVIDMQVVLKSYICRPLELERILQFKFFRTSTVVGIQDISILIGTSY